jgi:hypothetical protein
MKKKSVVCFLMAIAVSSVSGQTFLGGSLNAYTSNSRTEVTGYESRYYNFSVAPRLGYYLSERFAAGLEIPFSSYRSENQYTSSRAVYSNSSFGIGLFSRYYSTGTEHLHFFLEFQAQVTTGGGKEEQETGSVTNTTESRNLSLIPAMRPGLEIKLTDPLRFSISAGSLNYTWSKTTNNPGDNESVTVNSSFSFYLNGISFSLIYLFGR